MLLTGSGLIVSLPARELVGFRPSGSLFDEGELRKVGLSEELMSALTAVKQLCASRKLPLRFLARPEIFTHGESLAWLLAQLGGIKDHLCISDGFAVRPIPSLRNHLFLYRLGCYESAVALHRLNHCAPELLGSVTSQVNTAMVFGRGPSAISPPPVLLQVARQQGRTAGSVSAVKYHPYLPDPDAGAGVKRALASNVSLGALLKNVRQVTYVPLTPTACHDRACGTVLSELVAACCMDEFRGCVIRLPGLVAGDDTPTSRVLAQALQGVKLRVKPKHRPAITLTDADWIGQPPAALSCPVALALHSSYEFWKHPREHYAHFRDIAVFCPRASSSDEDGLRSLLSLALDRKPNLVFLRSPRESRLARVGGDVSRGTRASVVPFRVARG
jgi:hypothetical protein